MALSGTLSDLGIVDLLQFPNAGRKTGELVLAGEAGEGRLYYVKGRLVHVACGDNEGIDALVELVSWEEGEFEFRLGVEANKTTMEMDLHRALMQALKLRDERAEAKRKEAAPVPVEGVQDLKGAIEEFMAGASAVDRVLLAASGGDVVAQYGGDEGAESDISGMAKPLSAFWEAYPRQELSRIFLDDSAGIAVAVKLSTVPMFVVVTVSAEISLGMATVHAGKLAAALNEVAG